MKYLAKEHDFEETLARINSALTAEFSNEVAPPTNLPTTQIIGLPRSGTTILYQLLAKTSRIGYPSNLMAYFWQTPHIGAALQNRLAVSTVDLELTSLGGRTAQPLGPHEFGYFWRYTLGHSQNSMTQDKPAVPASTLQNTLDLVNTTFGKPTVYKNLLATSHIGLFGEQMKNQLFVNIKRDPQEVAASLLLIRDKLGLKLGEWFGTTPDNSSLVFKTDVEQVVHQVKSLNKQLSSTEIESNPMCLTLDYHELCKDPKDQIQRVARFIGIELTDDEVERIPAVLAPGNPLERLDKGKRTQLRNHFP